MSEVHWKCGFFPRCSIHRWKPLPREFSAENHAEMRQMRREGVRLGDIAQDFRTTTSSVSNIIRSRKEEAA